MKSVAKKTSTTETTVKARPTSGFVPTVFPGDSLSQPVGFQQIQLKTLCACGGGCPRCSGESPIQAKLKIGNPTDKYEQEADRVAEQIMRMVEPDMQRQIAKDGDKETIRTKKNGEVSSSVTPAISSGIKTLQSGGIPLSWGTRKFFEPRFGVNFSSVRLHYGPQASDLAQSLNAHAFTHKNGIYFNRGQYCPESTEGKLLLAHELTHFVQQTSGNVNKPNHDCQTPSSELVCKKSKKAISYQESPPVSIRLRVQKEEGGLIQRREDGTYISNQGDQAYLNGADQYYRSWRHPNIRRVGNIRDILANLSGPTPRTIDTIRIVSHAHHGGLLLGLMSDYSPNAFELAQTRLSTSAAFRGFFTIYGSLADPVSFTEFLRILRGTPVTAGFLTTIGANTGTPAQTSPVGIFLRALLDIYYLDNIRLPGNTVPNMPNRQALENYNRLRLRTYGDLLVRNATAAGTQSQMRSAIRGLTSQSPAILQGANLSFTPITQAEAQTEGDAITEPSSRQRVLRPEVSSVVREGGSEGARGTFIGDLNRVKSKITSNTHIKIRGCTVGQNPAFLDGVRDFFKRPAQPEASITEARPIVSAPDIFQYYFPPNTRAYGDNQRSEEQMQDDWQDSQTGIERSYHRSVRMRNQEMIQVVNDNTLAELCQRYGFDLGLIRVLNPHLSPGSLSPGAVVWLKAAPILAGTDSQLDDFCQTHLRNRNLWPRIWGYNPAIQNAAALRPNDRIWIVSNDIRLRAGEAAPVRRLGDFRTTGTFQDFRTELRGGRAFVSVHQGRPTMWMDRRRMGAATAGWFGSQGYSRSGRYMQFLANRPINRVTDPIFPGDPRFSGHIITRP